MIIPDEAIEAAARSIYLSVRRTNLDTLPWDTIPEDWQAYYRDSARAALEAAGPFIAAQSLRDAAEELDWVKPEAPCEDAESCCGSGESCDAMRPIRRVVGTSWLRGRADRLTDG
jgi:hypothetical protein